MAPRSRWGVTQPFEVGIADITGPPILHLNRFKAEQARRRLKVCHDHLPFDCPCLERRQKQHRRRQQQQQSHLPSPSTTPPQPNLFPFAAAPAAASFAPAPAAPGFVAATPALAPASAAAPAHPTGADFRRFGRAALARAAVAADPSLDDLYAWSAGHGSSAPPPQAAPDTSAPAAPAPAPITPPQEAHGNSAWAAPATEGDFCGLLEDNDFAYMGMDLDVPAAPATTTTMAAPATELDVAGLIDDNFLEWMNLNVPAAPAPGEDFRDTIAETLGALAAPTTARADGMMEEEGQLGQAQGQAGKSPGQAFLAGSLSLDDFMDELVPLGGGK